MSKDKENGYKFIIIVMAITIAIFAIPAIASSQITVTKEWNDNLTGTSANNRTNPTIVSAGSLSQQQLLDMFYPVGSYYETTDADFDPNDEWGGTWTLEEGGTAHISADTTNYTIGHSYGSNSLSYTPAGSITINGHTLTINEMPSHNHTITIVGDQSITSNGVRVQQQWGKGQPIGDNLYNTGGNQPHNHTGSFSGTTTSLNNMQKSIAVNRWHRDN